MGPGNCYSEIRSANVANRENPGGGRTQTNVARRRRGGMKRKSTVALLGTGKLPSVTSVAV